MKLILLFTLLFSTSLFASGTAINVTIEKVVTQQANSVGANRVCISVSDAISGTPSCNTSSRLCTDVTTPFGAAILSTALTAYATKVKVRVAGIGSCSIVFNAEDMDYIQLLD